MPNTFTTNAINFICRDGDAGGDGVGDEAGAGGFGGREEDYLIKI